MRARENMSAVCMQNHSSHVGGAVAVPHACARRRNVFSVRPRGCQGVAVGKKLEKGNVRLM